MNKKVVAGIGLIAGALGLYLWTTKKAKPLCTEGAKKCDAGNLYTCVNGKWELQELNSPTCVPPPSCSVDTDCPPGYVCDNGVCVPITPEVFYSPYGCVETTRGYWTSKQSLAESTVNGIFLPLTYPTDIDFRDCYLIISAYEGGMRDFPPYPFFFCPYCGGAVGAYPSFVAAANSLLSHIETSHPELPLNKPPAWLRFTVAIEAFSELLINGEPGRLGAFPPGTYHIHFHPCLSWTSTSCLTWGKTYDFDVTVANWGDRVTYDVNTDQISVITWKELSGYDVV